MLRPTLVRPTALFFSSLRSTSLPSRLARLTSLRPTRFHRRARLACGLALLLAALVPGAANADVNDYERETWRLINQERMARGLPELGSDTRLFAASEAHSEWMCANRILSHYGAGGSSPGTRATAQGYVWNAIGETLAQGYTTPSSVVLNGWKRSSGHWTILMSSRYRDIGVGYVQCSGTRLHYWTVMVGNSPYAPVPIGGDTGGAPTNTPLPTATTRPTTVPTTVATTVAPTNTPKPSATPRPSDPPPPTATATTPPSGVGGAIEGSVGLRGINRGGWADTSIYVNGAKVATTDADGRFRTSPISAGTHRLEARRAGALTAFRMIGVSGGTTDAGATTLLLGDIVPDQRVDYSDFAAMVGSWYRCSGQSGYDGRADLNRDLCVNYTDYYILRPSYGRSGPTAW